MPDVSPRGGTYTVGGINPYGFARTPPYNPAWVPEVGAKVGLYERLDYDTRGKGFKTRESYTNPPFLAVGGTATAPGRVPSWMQSGAGGVRRILRGYIRREEVYAFGDPNIDESQRRSNGRLYFMYNPNAIERSYQTLEEASSVLMPNTDPSGVPPFSSTTATFVLMFDRQEEVATLANHPGCLLDLAVFDLLARGGSPGQDDIPNRDPGGDEPVNRPGSTTHPGVEPAIDALHAAGSIADENVSLSFDPGLILYVVFSPSLTFRGSIMGASAIFEKFSHRMTPTRMELNITMRLYAVGQEPSLKLKSATEAKNAQNTGATGVGAAASAAAVDPTKKAATQAAADSSNESGRKLAMKWGENWIDKVPYDNAKRCDNVNQDSLTDTNPPHQPNYMDCSGFVSRCLHVIGWSEHLNLAQCASSGEYITLAKKYEGKNDIWAVRNLRRNPAPAVDSNMKEFLQFVHEGDILVRSPAGGKMGHVAWVHKDLGGGEAWEHKFETLETSSPNPPKNKVHTTATDVRTIIVGGHGYKAYDYVMRPQPIVVG